VAVDETRGAEGGAIPHPDAKGPRPAVRGSTAQQQYSQCGGRDAKKHSHGGSVRTSTIISRRLGRICSFNSTTVLLLSAL